MLKMNVSKAAPHSMRRGLAKFATVEDREWTTGLAVSVRHEIQFGARVDERPHIEILAARRGGKTRARSVVNVAPQPFNNRILMAVILSQPVVTRQPCGHFLEIVAR